MDVSTDDLNVVKLWNIFDIWPKKWKMQYLLPLRSVLAKLISKWKAIFLPGVVGEVGDGDVVVKPEKK